MGLKHEIKDPLSEMFNQIPDLMSTIEKAETCAEKMHVRRLSMDPSSIESNYKTIQDSVSALNDEKTKLADLIVQYIKGKAFMTSSLRHHYVIITSSLRYHYVIVNSKSTKLVRPNVFAVGYLAFI